ncbi:MAG: phosphohistidine phosphatase SixA [Gemmatimonadales bacterium]|jgi:phosphohistidine phosphatase
MELYLVQHGEATSKAEDPARPLTPAGRSAVERVAQAAAAIGVAAQMVYHSGKLRAAQTADILAQHLAHGRETTELDGMGPTDDPAPLAARVADLAHPALLVGHLPFLSRLASLLLTGDAEQEIIAFQNAGIVALSAGDEGNWRARWILTPELVERGM